MLIERFDQKLGVIERIGKEVMRKVKRKGYAAFFYCYCDRIYME